jgi:hypothetical protein
VYFNDKGGMIMGLINKKLGRRQFMTVGSMVLGAGALGAGILMNQPRKAFAQLN